MRLLRIAVERERWDLAAHTIILATARLLNSGDRPHAKRSRQKKKVSKRD
jgi:hypothetical protein